MMVWATSPQENPRVERENKMIIQNADFVYILICPLIDINEKGVK